ncbi:MAG: acyl-CoA/acyl-ACP dehydrogenase [Frankiaceae bacterium]|nr:acyl-CoA/acyl-ACP dehydrogenase [Frankiaceae bacterium]
MNVELTSEEEALRSTTARFLDDRMPIAAVRDLRDDPAGFSMTYWSQGAELGWMSLLVPEDLGGGTVSDNAVADLALIAHEFGTHAAPGPLVPCNVVVSALAGAGDAHAEALEALMSGASTAAWCYSEPPPNDALGHIDLEIRVDGDDVVITGTKRPVENGAAADLLLVTGRTGAGLSQVLLAASTPGVTVKPLSSADLSRRYATVHFDDVRVPVTAAVGGVGEAAAEVERQLQLAIVVSNAEAVGALQQAFDMTASWVNDRYSFGRPLSTYQEIKHRLADLFTWLQASHAINDVAITAVGSGSPDAAELTSAAKAYISEYGGELVQDCVQLHGGIGVTFEHDLHLFVRRVTVNRACYGTFAEHRRRVGQITEMRKDRA